METTVKENFAIFCKYLGSGDINSKLWFVGIEEGGEVITEQNLSEQIKLCKQETQFFDDASSSTPVWSIISELLYEKFSQKNNLDKQEYRKKLFHKDFSYFFLTELFPLPRPNNSTWSENYYKLFGYTQSDFYEYLSDVRSFRFPILYNKWAEKKPELTICFGSTYWNEFINLFRLGHSAFNNLPDSDILIFPKEKVLLCPFFDYRIIKSKERDILKNYIDKM